MANYRSTLEVEFGGGKGIPYGGFGDVRPDGGANHGFKNLKSNLDEIGEVPELLDDPHLMAVVFAINQPAIGLFSVGCVSGDFEDGGRHNRAGYVEVAFNSKPMVANASNYFPLFFHFGRLLHDRQFTDPVGFSWALTPATFIDAGVDGFTACIFVNTGAFGSKDEASVCWERALAVLATYLGSIPIQAGEPIYPPAGLVDSSASA